ncbi:uncharacterized protein LOC113289894 isoform X3 [Papaver somniferum]|uniref:uncharacterized protein LOC113289894 isoform X3 n=1 Tax=Papaver somniferum TaxID=3469 RepID=UPI000E6F7520|nr:uncharacterized protein LOC113289894 isoform X3 [Papaver somniferum]
MTFYRDKSKSLGDTENHFVPMALNPSVFTPDEIIYESVNEWHFSLIGRRDLVHLKISVAAANLRNQWKLTGLWETESQYLKLRFWERDFKPEQQKPTSAFVWILFPDLSIEYWKEDILMSMGKAVG